MFRHFYKQNKCAINHYLFINYDSVILSWFFIIYTIFYLRVKIRLCLPKLLMKRVIQFVLNFS
jgi:hypothetical protein